MPDFPDQSRKPLPVRSIQTGRHKTEPDVLYLFAQTDEGLVRLGLHSSHAAKIATEFGEMLGSVPPGAIKQ